jgi:hypothetical protein
VTEEHVYAQPPPPPPHNYSSQRAVLVGHGEFAFTEDFLFNCNEWVSNKTGKEKCYINQNWKIHFQWFESTEIREKWTGSRGGGGRNQSALRSFQGPVTFLRKWDRKPEQISRLTWFEHKVRCCLSGFLHSPKKRDLLASYWLFVACLTTLTVDS